MRLQETDLIGVLSGMALTDVEFELFFKGLSSLMGTDFLKVLDSVIKEQSRNSVLTVLDVFAGTTVSIPSRVSVATLIRDIKVYLFVKKDNFSTESIDKALSVFEVNKNRLKAILKKVAKYDE